MLTAQLLHQCLQNNSDAIESQLPGMENRQYTNEQK